MVFLYRKWGVPLPPLTDGQSRKASGKKVNGKGGGASPIHILYIWEDIKTKKMFQFGHCLNLGGGYPCPNFFAPFFYLSKSLVNGCDGGKSR